MNPRPAPSSDSDLNDLLRRKVEEAFADPKPNASASDVFERLRAHHAQRMKTEGK
jgi:hypothetical protein